MRNESTKERASKLVQVLLCLLILPPLYIATRCNFLLFHSLAEIFSIMVAGAIFVVAWNSRNFNQSHYLLWVGVAYLAVAFLDLLHTFAYAGMGVFPQSGIDLPTQLWIAARYVESLSLFFALLFASKKVKAELLLAIYAVITALLLMSIFYFDIFPECYNEVEQRLTTFKIVSEYVISGILAITGIIVYVQRNNFDRRVYSYIQATLILSILAEISFTLYTDPYGLANLVGHYFKIMSFVVVYKALIETGLQRPYNLMFKNLNEQRASLLASEEQLQQLAAELRRSNQDLQQFAYATSHDLQEPLRMITGYLQLVDRRFKDQVPQQVNEFIDYALAGAGNMQQLILDLLSYARIGSVEPDFQRIPLQLALDDALRNLAHRITESDAVIDQHSMPEVVGDRSQLTQLFQNLIGNALKFRKPDEPPHIVITAESKPDGFWHISISDNGIGMADEDTERIFAVFQRLHSRDDYPGSGIGLASCKRIVERHGGTIRASSEVGRGTTIVFTIPKTLNG